MVFKRDGTVPKGVRKCVGVFWGVTMMVGEGAVVLWAKQEGLDMQNILSQGCLGGSVG